jgi:hypothetical protein
MTSLHLNLHETFANPYSPPSIEQQIDLHTLSPLLSCSGLTSFVLYHDYPLRMNAWDTFFFSKHLPELRVLSLNCESIHLTADASGCLSVVSDVIRCCPHLVYLGIYVRQMSGKLSSSSTERLPDNVHFHELNVGSSLLSDLLVTAVWVRNSAKGRPYRSRYCDSFWKYARST